MSAWPIDWPISIDVMAEDAYHIQIAELAATAAMRLLTLYRVGGLPITVMPCADTCHIPAGARWAGQVGHSYLPFWPVLTESGAYTNCGCGGTCGADSRASVFLAPPIGRIDAVVVDGVTLDSTDYRVENGNRLVRTDGGTFPSCAGDNFTVTYLNGYEVDVLGQAAGGILAAEYLKLLKTGKCRLPSGATEVARQGINVRIETGMFPNGITNIPEVDTYVVQWNPNGLRTRPMVYSPDLPPHNTILWGM